MIILPRQARDKHRENSRKQTFLAGVLEEVTVDYYKTEDFVPAFEAAYPDKFNKMDYMGSCCRIRLIAEQILPHIDSVIVLDGGDQVGKRPFLAICIYAKCIILPSINRC